MARVADNGIDRLALSAVRRLDGDPAPPDAPAGLPAQAPSGRPTDTPPTAPSGERGSSALALALAAAALPALDADPVTVHQNQGAPGLSELLNSVLA
jgi:hypothetical protein